MKPQRPRLLVIGTLPPPFIGPSIAMAELIKSRRLNEAFEIIFCDISDRRPLMTMGNFDWRNAWLAVVHICRCIFLLLSRWPAVVYFGVSQGLWGYLRDLGFFVPAVLLRRRVVVHLRGSEFNEFYESLPWLLQRLTQLLFRQVAAVIVLSVRLQHVFRNLVPASRIFAVPNGVEVSPFSGDPSVMENPGNGMKVLWLSNLFVRKGIAEFIAALPAVLQAHPETRVTVAGEWESPFLRDRLLEFLSSSGVLSQVAFVGKVDGENKAALFRQHSVFVLTPIQPEGMPWSILEAMSAGLPVISTDQGAISDMVLDGRTGFIVKPEASEIAKRIIHLISRPEEARQMGTCGFNHVRSEFSREAYEQKLIEVLAKAHGGAGMAPEAARPAAPTEQSAG